MLHSLVHSLVQKGGIMGLTKRKDGRFCKSFSIDGKRVYFYSTADTEKQAAKDIDKQLIDYTSKAKRKKCNFKEIADRVIEAKAYNTSQSYRYALKHLEGFYNRDIADIAPADIQNILDAMAKQKYSISAIQKVKILFSLIRKEAALSGAVLANEYFMKAITLPKLPKSKVTNPDHRLLKRVIEANKHIPFGDFAMCLLYTGLRRGELAALQKSDIDFKRNLIRIDKSVVFVGNTPKLKPTPKTETSIADIPILSPLIPTLKSLTHKIKADSFLFGDDKPLSKTQIRKRWDKYCKTIGYPDLTIHQLRHAYAAVVYASGVDVKTAQRLLRHADITTTLNIYTDFQNQLTNEAVSKIESYVSGS